MKTYTEIAQDALLSPSVMCNLLNAARCARFPGYWEGSAFRSHPCGIISGVIKFTNDWHCDDYCSIAITDGEWSRDFCRDSRAYGDPHPRATNGNAVSVWSGCGKSARWASEEMRAKLESKLLAVLTSAAEHVEAHAQRKAAEERAKTEARAIDDAKRTAAALEKATSNAQ